MKRLSILISLLAVPTLAAAQPGDAPPSATPSSTDAPPEKLFGIGYKLGNGIGFLGGDVIINPIPHVSIDLYATYFSVSSSMGDSGTAYAFAPAIQGHLREGWRSSPYAAIGMQYVHLTLGPGVGTGEGVFANLGYEWKWRSGLGIQLGGGVQYIEKVSATSGDVMITTGGQVAPNLEFGIRYMFL